MTPEEIDLILNQAVQRELPPDAGRANLNRLEDVLLSDLRPAPAMAPVRVFLLRFLLLFALFAAFSAMVLGLHGFHVLGWMQRLSIMSSLLLAGWLAATACARAMRPASGASLGGLVLLLATAGFPILFAALLRNYSTWHFVAEGVPCLVAGLCVAVPVGCLAALILRRGYVLDWSRAGLAAGVLAGLSGLSMLELHCPNLKAIHAMVWHLAVVACSSALGYLVGRITDRLRCRRYRPAGK